MISTYGNKCYSAIPAISKGDVLISDPNDKETFLTLLRTRRATSMTSMRSCYGVFADRFIFRTVWREF